MSQDFVCMLCKSDKMGEATRTELRDDTEHIVVQCAECGFQQLSPMPTQEEMDDYYRKDMQAVSIGYKPVFHTTDTLRRIKDLQTYWWPASIVKEKSILDFGAGYGDFVLCAKEAGLQVQGLEPCVSRREVAAEQGVNLLGFIPEEEHFDVITMFHVLEHLPDPVEFLNTMAEARLNEGGTIVAEVPNANDWLLDLSPAYRRWCSMKCHLSYFTPTTLRATAYSAGFGDVYIQPVHRYSLINNINWLLNGVPQMENPSYKAEGEVLSIIDDYYKGLLMSSSASDTLVAVMGGFGK